MAVLSVSMLTLVVVSCSGSSGLTGEPGESTFPVMIGNKWAIVIFWSAALAMAGALVQ